MQGNTWSLLVSKVLTVVYALAENLVSNRSGQQFYKGNLFKKYKHVLKPFSSIEPYIDLEELIH